MLRTVCGLQDEPRVSIVTKDQTYILTKQLVCSSSAVFDATFNGPFKESSTLKLQLEDITKEQFDLVIQWIYAGSLKIGSQSGTLPSALLSQYISFVKLADRFDLYGDFSSIYEKVARILSGNGDNTLTAEHIRARLELPRGHILRNTVAKRCALCFLEDKEFKFKKELLELEGFSSDIFLVLKPCIEQNHYEIKKKLRKGLQSIPQKAIGELA
jgi:hypothetical protein